MTLEDEEFLIFRVQELYRRVKELESKLIREYKHENFTIRYYPWEGERPNINGPTSSTAGNDNS